MLTFFLATNQAKVLTFDRTFDFQMKLAKEKGIKVDCFDKTRKKDFIENKLKDYEDQTLTTRDDGVRLTLLKMEMSLLRAFISESMRFRQKFKF